MKRKPNSGTTVAEIEKTNNLPEGTIRNLDGSNARGDKQIETLGEEYERKIAMPDAKLPDESKADGRRIED